MTLTRSELPDTGVPEPESVVVDVAGIPVSALLAESPDPRAVLVALHGGATTGAYFDYPGHPELSLVRLARRLGFTVLAPDRPGYGASAPFTDRLATPAARVDLMFGAVQALLAGLPRGAGLFLLSHSAGSELTLRMATDVRYRDLIGLELAGTGREYHPDAMELLRSVSPDNPRPPGVGDLIWNPIHLYPPDVLRGGAIAVPGPRIEATGVVDWPNKDFPELAARVRIPVRFTVGDHERVWRSDPAGLAEVGALFTAAPRVVLNRQFGTAHNTSVGYTAAAYHLGVLSFVEECIVTAETAPPEG